DDGSPARDGGQALIFFGRRRRSACARRLAGGFLLRRLVGFFSRWLGVFRVLRLFRFLRFIRFLRFLGRVAGSARIALPARRLILFRVIGDVKAAALELQRRQRA